MAMLASKASYPSYTVASGQMSSRSTEAPLTARRVLAPTTSNQMFASPTESEFSDAYDGGESVRSWDEKRVGEWLRSINCGQYEQLFKANHFNGENLLECDQAVLKEMGIKKIGDRVRLFVAIKNLRNKTYSKQRKRNRDSFATLDNPSYTPPSSASPRPSGSAGQRSQTSQSYRQNQSSGSSRYEKAPSRPESPFLRYPGMSPMESARREGQGYFNNSSNPRTGEPPSSATTVTTRAIPTHNRQSPSISMGPLPEKSGIIRVIYARGETRVVSTQNCKTAEDIIRSALRKFNQPEHHVKNFCFYVLDGIEPEPANCRRINDTELVRITSDPSRAERNRLILRKIHAGEPGNDELQRAAKIAIEESETALAQNVAMASTKTLKKITQITGADWKSYENPQSPTSAISPTARGINLANAQSQLETPREVPRAVPRQQKKGVLREFLGQRPPSELISSDLHTYFPDHQKDEIENTVRMSMRRSARISRATSRLSTASNLSFSSSMKDAPPIPSVPESWLNSGGHARAPRPLSITKLGGSHYRDSVASSMLEPLQEESPIDPDEPDRKSYVSFDSGSDTMMTLGESSNSYYHDTSISTPDKDTGGSLNEELSQALAEDGEEQDQELTQFLSGDSWENIKWMKGALIGQGSFGSVYLALHSITGELMAVKQVEMPSNTGNKLDIKKRGMVDALKREIGLLKELQHENIVQYLGSSSDEEHLNIFLEYVPGGSVAAMLNSYGPLREPLIRNFVRQILNGLAYLHKREIIHRDIKGANVLVDNKGGIKISDFGISKRVEASTILGSGNGGAAGHAHRPSLQGSVFWMAPEVVKQTSYTRKADIWSLGCLVVEMFTGTHPYPDCSQLQAIFKIGNSTATPTLPEVASDEAKAFLQQTFEMDHNKRPSAEELLLSPFLNPTA